ncbi:MAG: 50S ribosomal protein L11 methyltransferase [Pseudomonadota bacterium]
MTTGPEPDRDRLAETISAQTRRLRPPLTPEIEIHGATELAPIWTATEAALAQRLPGAPFWAFAWPGGQALARWILDRPESVRGRAVLAVACGAGVEAIAAALAGAARVVANDLDPAALVAAEMNARLNGVTLTLDPKDHAAPGAALPDAEVLLLGDGLYEAEPARRLLEMLARARRRGAEVLIGDPDRGRLPAAGLEPLASWRVPVFEDVEDAPERRATVYRLGAAG